MALSDKQRRALRAKLSYRHVKTRVSQGATLSYVEGWHAIAEANRIFGYDSWDRQTQSPHCIWSETQRGQTVCFYSTKVRITVRAGDTVTVREGIGTGSGRSPSAELAHEIALKAAETDATKRALATFGNPFGLALYDKDQAHVTKAPHVAAERTTPSALATSPTPPDRLIVRHLDGRAEPLEEPDAFVAAMLNSVSALENIEDVYAFWEANMAALSALRSRSKQGEGDPVATIVGTLKGRARMLSRLVSDKPAASGSNSALNGNASRPVVSAALAIPKEKRLRDKRHLEFVARQPCLICGRKPAQAHHLKFAQPRAMALKVSDEFTLPLCNIHHDELHRTGDERAWWARHGIIEPLKFAARLWAASRQADPQEEPILSSPEHEEHRDTQPEPTRPGAAATA